MGSFVSAFSVQHWLESVPQGYLRDTVHGCQPGLAEPPWLREDERLREDALRITTQLVLGERCALAASAGLIRCAPDAASAAFLATQVLDEARHVEVFTQRMLGLGVRAEALEDCLREFANPHLARFAGALLEQVDRGRFVAGVVGQNVVLEGMAFAVFELLHALHCDTNPAFAAVLGGTIADERRHVGFGENHVGAWVRRHPEERPAIARLQQEMSAHMLKAIGSSFSRLGAGIAAMHAGNATPPRWRGQALETLEPDALERALTATVTADFHARLARLGIDDASPAAA